MPWRLESSGIAKPPSVAAVDIVLLGVRPNVLQDGPDDAGLLGRLRRRNPGFLRDLG